MSWTRKFMHPADAYILASIGAVLLFPLIMALALLAYCSDITVGPRPLYRWLLREDGWVESLTALLLAVAAVLAVVAASRMSEKLRWSRTFFFLFAAFSILMALEEISWGQRLFSFESGEFFATHSDQNEINFHNALQPYLQQQGSPIVWTRKIAALVLFAYGVILPVLNRFAPFATMFRRLRLVIPPSKPVLRIAGAALVAAATLCPRLGVSWPCARRPDLTCG